MEDALDALQRAIERRGVAQIPGHILEGQIRNRTIGARRAQKYAHFVPAGHELSCYVATQEARRACDQRGHATFTPSSSARASCWTRTSIAWALGAEYCSALTTGSTIRENDSHHVLRMSLRASAIFRCKAPASGVAEFAPPFGGVITIPSTSSVRAN